MSIQINCSKCEALLSIPENAVGKRAKCKKCGEIFEIQAPSDAQGTLKDGTDSKALESEVPPASSRFNSPDPFASAATSPVGFSSSETEPPSSVSPYASAPPANPYNSPAMPPLNMQPSGGNDSIAAVQPLVDAAGWMSLVGWMVIIFGAIYSLPIVTLLVTWLPIWMGATLVKAGKALKTGGTSGPAVFEASRNLKTFFVIAGILTTIYVVIVSLYILFLLGLMIFALIGAMTA